MPQLKVSRPKPIFPADATPVPASSGTVPAPVPAPKNEAPLIQSKPAAPIAVNIPGFLSPTVPQVSAAKGTNYLSFGSDKSKNAGAQLAMGIEPGDIFVSFDGALIKLEQGVPFFVVDARSFATHMQPDGSIDCALLDVNARLGYPAAPEKPTPNYVRMPVKLDAHISAVVLVQVNGEWHAFKTDCMGTKSGALENVLRAIEAAGNPESGWVNLSDAHRIASAFPAPFGRVCGRMSTQYQVSKSSGLEYYRGSSTSTPATIDQMKELQAYFASDESQEELKTVHQSFTHRVRELTEIAAKCTAQ